MLTLCSKQLPPVALIICKCHSKNKAIFVYALLRSCVLKLICSSMLPTAPYWGHETYQKSKTTALGQWKTWSQDLRRQKWNFLKTRRKLWSSAARDRAYSYPNSCHAYFSWNSLCLTRSEDLSINALWSSTRRTWLLYYYCLWITAKIILLTCECWAVSIKHGLRTTDYGLGIKHGLGIKRGLSITDWV